MTLCVQVRVEKSASFHDKIICDRHYTEYDVCDSLTRSKMEKKLIKSIYVLCPTIIITISIK